MKYHSLLGNMAHLSSAVVLIGALRVKGAVQTALVARYFFGI